MNLRALLAQAQNEIIHSLGLPDAEARIEAQALLRHVLGNVSRAWLIAHDEQALTSEQFSQFQALLARRLQGEPIAYILGNREFYGLDFSVTPDVLIPRSDTETLVEVALQHIAQHQPCRVLDLGTGSGAIAITIASQRPQAEVMAVDSSNAALAVARMNAEKLKMPNVHFLQSNWFAELEGSSFDIVVSNPPYIAEDDQHLNQGDLRFEPASALASGTDGLDSIRQIISEAPRHLNSGGWLLLEHGYDQAWQVAELMRIKGFAQVESRPDLSGILRVTIGKV